MINDGKNNVPDKTIAVFYDDIDSNFTHKDLPSIISKLPKKREWFDSHFYRCLPLTIANQYGFMLTSQFDIEFEWDGTNNSDGVKFYFTNEEWELSNKSFPRIQSHFGHGIITVLVPFSLRTPPGVNLLTISPPNVVIPNITVMSGVIETDNLRRDFTFNLKVQTPNVRMRITAGHPLAAFIPVPRYFADSFELVDAETIFNEEILVEEFQAKRDSLTARTDIDYLSKDKVGKHYMKGMDIYGNKFPDHQKP